MKKYLATCLISIFYLTAFSQTNWEKEFQGKMDSLKKLAPQLKGPAKVDCLNSIVDIYQIMDEDNQMQVDSIGPYTMQAINEAMKARYKRGLGYAYLKMSYRECLKADLFFQKNKRFENDALDHIASLIKNASKIANELKDNEMMAGVFSSFAQLEEVQQNKDKSIAMLDKAVEYLQHSPNADVKIYREKNFVVCPGCIGNNYKIGELYMWMIFVDKDTIKAKKYLDLAIKYFEKAGSQTAVSSAYMRMGNFVASNDADAGAKYYKLAADNYALTGVLTEPQVNANIMIAASYWAKGEFEEGLEYSKKSVRLVEKLIAEDNGKLNRVNTRGKAYYWMGRFYTVAGDFETALSFMRKAGQYYQDDPESINGWSASIGEAYRLKGDYDSAMHYLSRFEGENDRANGKTYLGRLYISKKQYNQAWPLIEHMIEITIGNPNKKNQGNLGGLYTDAAMIWMGKKDYAMALEYGRLGYSLLSTTKRNQRLIESCQVLSEIFNLTKNTDSAYHYLKLYTVLKDSFLNRQYYFRLNDYKKEVEEERKISQINLLNKDNQLKEQKLKQQATIRNSLIVGLILLLLFGLFIFRNLTQRKRSALEKQKLENEKKQAELEMQALRAQMNPHFIFNCLSSINRFILKNESKIASNYLTRFSRLMRMVLNNSQRSLISLDDELEMLELYLEMERLRFKNSFDYGITYLNKVDSDNIFIPPLLLQPFCENAVWHGLMNKGGQGRLDIELSMEDNILNCVISDNGVGREKAEEVKSKTAEKEKSMGLKITTERLALLNKEKDIHTFYEIEDLKDENGNATGTKVTVKISFKETIDELV